MSQSVIVIGHKALEGACQSLPELVSGILAYLRRRSVETTFVREVIEEIGLSAAKVDSNRELVADLVEFEGLKRDWETAFIWCGLSYVALTFVLPSIIVGIGFAFWIIVFVISRYIVPHEEGPRTRADSRPRLYGLLAVSLLLSIIGKMAGVFMVR